MNRPVTVPANPASVQQLRALQKLSVERLREAARDGRCSPIRRWPRAQRERLRMAFMATLGQEIDRGAGLLEILPLLAGLCGLEAADEPVRAKGRPKDGPLLAVLTVLIGLPRKAQKRAAIRAKRPDGAGQRGPLAGADHDTFRPADAKRLRAVVEIMARNDSPIGADAAAKRMLRDILPLSRRELGDGSRDFVEPTVKRLVRACKRFGYAADMPRYRLHCSIHQALQRGDIAIARELVVELQLLPSQKCV